MAKRPPSKALQVRQPSRKESAASSSDHAKVNVFISYARSDQSIARTIREELISVDHRRVECFLDTETIESGMNFRDKLDTALETADWLICIYTGKQTDFCGYEIGVFSKARLREQAGSDSRLVCLHDQQELPNVFPNQNSQIVFPEPPTDGAPFDEAEFYAHAPIAKFFADFFGYKGLYVARTPAEAEQQLQSIRNKAKRVTDAFKAARGKDKRFDTPIQLGIEVVVPPGAGDKLTSIPAISEVSGTYGSFELFGLRPPMAERQLPATTWGRVREASHDTIVPWMDRLESDMMAAANGDRANSPEATFRCGGKIYRAILVRHIEYWNRYHLFGVVFVETLPRGFTGSETTSLILAGMVMASRFRFHYVEERIKVEARFREDVPDRTFEINMRQFCHNLFRVEQDAAELGLRDKNQLLQAFGDGRLEVAKSFFDNWEQAKTALFQVIPKQNEPFRADMKPQIGAAITAFLDEIQAQNLDFLIASLDAYKDELLKVSGFSTR